MQAKQNAARKEEHRAAFCWIMKNRKWLYRWLRLAGLPAPARIRFATLWLAT